MSQINLTAYQPALLNGLNVTATTGTLTLAALKALTISNSLTLTGTDGSSIALGAGGTVLYSGGALGTPTSGTLTNCTLPLGGLTGLGTGVATALAVALNTAGGLAPVSSPTLVTPVLGVASATSLAIGGATIGTNALAITGTSAFSGNITPVANDGAALGTTALMWSDVFLASGAVLNYNNGGFLVTHSLNTLTFYNPTATTGVTTIDLRAGATAGSILRVLANDGTTVTASITGAGLAAFAGISAPSIALTGSINVGAAGAFYFNTRSLITSPSDGRIALAVNAGTTGVSLDFSTAALLKVRNQADNAYGTVDALGYKVSGTAGASFGPGLPTSITVVNGLITAIS